MSALTARTLQISLGGTDYTAQCFSAAVTTDAADDKDVTFAEAAAGGGRLYTLGITVTQDMAANSVWSKVWDAAGTDVAVLMKPYGNATPSASQPHFTMTATVVEPKGTLFGGDANSSNTERWKLELEWPLLAKPTRVTA